ncbi:MAG: hypothetical protein IH951_08305 [Bacteroidetes bacterium]|nr:hypothetical protein [Bacteroidota bacterium]
MTKFAYIAVISIIVLSAGVAQAQRREFSPEQMRERQQEANEELMAQLELSDEQAPKVAEILSAALDVRIEMIEEIRSGEGRRQGMREKMAEINDETEASLADVLSENQMEKYNKILAERPRRGRRNGPSN